MDIIRQSTKWEMRWYNPEQTVLHCHVYDEWTWPEAYEMMRALDEIVCDVDRDMYTIIQLEGLAQRVPIASAFHYIRQAIHIKSSSREQGVMFVSSSSVLTTLIELVLQTQRFLPGFPDNVRHYTTMDEALAYLRDMGALALEDLNP